MSNCSRQAGRILTNTDEKHQLGLQIWDIFDSGNAVLRETFTPPPHPHHPKNGPEMSSKSWIAFYRMFSNFCLAFELTVLGFLYAHYTNEINKQKVINKSRRLLPYVLKFLFSIWTNSFRLFVFALHKQKIVNKRNCLLPNVIFSIWSANIWLIVCAPYV